MPRGMPEGFSITVDFDDFPNLTLYPKKVTPPGVEGGDAIDTTTQLNEDWKTKWPQALKEMTGLSFTAAYDPVFYQDAVDAVNVLQIITVNFPNGGTLNNYGWLRSFKPNALEIGQQPTAECMVEFSCETGATPVVEQGPEYVAP